MSHIFSNRLPLLDCVSVFVFPFTDCKSSSKVDTSLMRSNNSIQFILDYSLSVVVYLLLNKPIQFFIIIQIIIMNSADSLMSECNGVPYLNDCPI